MGQGQAKVGTEGGAEGGKLKKAGRQITELKKRQGKADDAKLVKRWIRMHYRKNLKGGTDAWADNIEDWAEDKGNEVIPLLVDYLQSEVFSADDDVVTEKQYVEGIFPMLRKTGKSAAELFYDM